jgi:hypothetical protein
MVPLLKRIRMQLLQENRFSKYLLYAIGEILLIVVGILIAMKINNYNNNKITEKEAVIAYQNIKQQVFDDKQELIKVIDYNNSHSKAYEYGNAIITKKDYSKIDSLALIAMILSRYSDFHTSGNIYETLVNSGDLKLMKNKEVTSAIQKLETTYIFINNLENIHWELIINELSQELKGVVNYSTIKVIEPERLYGVKLQNIFFEIIALTKYKDAVYKEAMTEIDGIITLIDEELSLTRPNSLNS